MQMCSAPAQPSQPPYEYVSPPPCSLLTLFSSKRAAGLATPFCTAVDVAPATADAADAALSVSPPPREARTATSLLGLRIRDLHHAARAPPHHTDPEVERDVEPHCHCALCEQLEE